jgi:hypothetical protein
MAAPSGFSNLAAGPGIVYTIQLAAELASLTARVVGRNDLAQRARELVDRTGPLAREDAIAYEEFLRTRSPEAKERTIELPLRMAELAADAAELAVEAAATTRGAVGGDAKVGVLLADAATRAAALLVRLNGGDPVAVESAIDRAARAAAQV